MNYNIRGKNIILGNPDSSDGEVKIKSNEHINFNICDVDVFKITCNGVDLVSGNFSVPAIDISSTNDATSKSDTNASIYTAGGLAVSKSIFTNKLDTFNSAIHLNGSQSLYSDDSLTTSIQVGGTSYLNVTSSSVTIPASTNLVVSDTTNNTTYAGAQSVEIAGGLKVAGDIKVPADSAFVIGDKGIGSSRVQLHKDATVGYLDFGLSKFHIRNDTPESVVEFQQDKDVVFHGTNDASSSTVGGVVMSGGLAVAKKVYSGSGYYGDIMTTIQPNVITMASLTTTGTLNAGSISSGFGAIDNGTSSIRCGNLYAGDPTSSGIQSSFYGGIEVLEENGSRASVNLYGPGTPLSGVGDDFGRIRFSGNESTPVTSSAETVASIVVDSATASWGSGSDERSRMQFFVNNGTSTTEFFRFDGASGVDAVQTYKDIDFNGNDHINESDIRLKSNVIKYKKNFLEIVNKCEVKSFNFKKEYNYNPEKKRVGLIAQDLEKYAPELVSEKKKTRVSYGDEDKVTCNDRCSCGHCIYDCKVVNHSGLMYVMWGAIQELSEQNRRLRIRLSKLENR